MKTVHQFEKIQELPPFLVTFRTELCREMQTG